MTTLNTTFRNSSHGGKVCETLVPSSHGRHLNVITMKRSGGQLSTTVTSVVVQPPSPSGFYGISYMPFSDYNVCAVRETIRCTEKAIRGQHQLVLNSIDQYLSESESFYNQQA